MTTSSPGSTPQLPNIQLNITSTTVTAKPRKLKAKWSQQAAQDLRDLWGGTSISRPDNALDLFNDALNDPDYDPKDSETYKGLYRWPDGRVATPEEIKKELAGDTSSLVASMADEMTAEIDREIMKDLNAQLGR